MSNTELKEDSSITNLTTEVRDSEFSQFLTSFTNMFCRTRFSDLAPVSISIILNPWDNNMDVKDQPFYLLISTNGQVVSNRMSFQPKSALLWAGVWT